LIHRIKGNKRVAEDYLFRMANSLPYNGADAGFDAISGGQVDLYGSGGFLIPQIKAGKLRTILQIRGKPINATGLKIQDIKKLFKDTPVEILDLPSGCSLGQKIYQNQLLRF